MLSNVWVQRVDSIPHGGRLLLTGADDGRGRVLWVDKGFLGAEEAQDLADALSGLDWEQAAALLRSCF